MKKVWTEEKIRKLVKDYNIKTRQELRYFHKDDLNGFGAHAAAKRFGILDDLFGKVHYWTKEECAKLAAKCKFRSEFSAKYNNAYCASVYNGWLDEITQHMPICKDLEAISKERYRYLIYAYEELTTHSVYVGLTNNLERRDDEHRNPVPSKKDSLYKFCLEHNVEIPKPKILEQKLAATVAGVKEAEWWYKYRADGWNMINSEYALGYYGGCIEKKWTEEKVRQYLAEHPEIKSRGQLCDAKMGAYLAAQRLGLFDELFGEPLNKPYTREDIIEYVRQHPEIKRRKELKLSSGGIFSAARRFNMLEELFGKPDIKKYTEDDVKEYLKQHPEIKTRKQFENSHKQLYKAASKFNIFDELFGESLHKTHTEREIREYLKEHPEITRRIDLKTNNNNLYHAALKMGILESLFGESLRKEHTEEELRLYLKEHPEITRRDELLKMNNSMYYLADKLKLLNELFGDGRVKRTKWTKETIKQYIKDNPDIKKRSDLMVKAAGAYDKAKRLKILDELFPNTDRK